MKTSDYLSKEELRQFTARSDAMGAWLVFKNWFYIAALFAIAAYWSNPFVTVLVVMLLGGRLLFATRN